MGIFEIGSAYPSQTPNAHLMEITLIESKFSCSKLIHSTSQSV